MTNQQIQNIYKKQMGYYLDLIVFLDLADATIDFGYLTKTSRFVFVFEDSSALDLFLLKVLVVANNNPEYLSVDFERYNTTLCLTTTEKNG